MTALFGVPLCGTCFVPLTIGIATFIIFWIVFISKKNLQNTESSDKVHKEQALEPDSTQSTKEKAKEKKRKSCGGSGGCCSKKDGKSGACGTKKKAINVAKVFVDSSSILFPKFVSVLSEKFSGASAQVEFLFEPDIKETDLSNKADGSLCIFILDTSVPDGFHQWLKKALSILKSSEKPLTGMKYTVFMYQNSVFDSSSVEAVDHSLHKLGAVRVCRAESGDHPSMVVTSHFENWVSMLCAQVQKWNEPQNKGCKCGSAKKKSFDGDSNDDACSSSNKCSDSEEEHILDLEDIGSFR